jgi:hypothetical protein
MKPLHFLITLILLGSYSANAQQSVSKSHQKPLTAAEKREKNLQFVKSHFPSVTKVETKKTRGGSRLINRTQSQVVTSSPYVYEMSDSTNYYYKSNYGYDETPFIFSTDFDVTSLTDNQQNYYDSSLRYTFDFMSGTVAVSDSTVCTFNANHSLLSERSFGLQFPFYTSQTNTYNPANLRTVQSDTMVFMLTDTSISRSQMAYDASNRLIRFFMEDYDTLANAWVPFLLDSFFYTGSNLTSARIYEYDQLSSSFLPTEFYTLTYSGANILTTVLGQIWTGTSWENDLKVDYTYNGSNQLTTTEYKEWNGASWDNLDRENRTYGAGPYPVTLVYQEWDGSMYQNSDRNVFVFNASNQVTHDSSFTWDAMSNAWVHANLTTYAYESFIPQSVQQLPELKGSLTIYPVPANEQLSITANWDEPQAVSAFIYDMSGRVMQHIQWPRSGNIHQTINISGLPAGSYLLSLQNEKGQRTQRFTKN